MPVSMPVSTCDAVIIRQGTGRGWGIYVHSDDTYMVSQACLKNN